MHYNYYVAELHLYIIINADLVHACMLYIVGIRIAILIVLLCCHDLMWCLFLRATECGSSFEASEDSCLGGEGNMASSGRAVGCQ